MLTCSLPSRRRNPGIAVASKRSVALGELTDFGVEILSGIESGDRVITAGVSVIRDGQRVRTD